MVSYTSVFFCVSRCSLFRLSSLPSFYLVMCFCCPRVQCSVHIVPSRDQLAASATPCHQVMIFFGEELVTNSLQTCATRTYVLARTLSSAPLEKPFARSFALSFFVLSFSSGTCSFFSISFFSFFPSLSFSLFLCASLTPLSPSSPSRLPLSIPVLPFLYLFPVPFPFFFSASPSSLIPFLSPPLPPLFLCPVIASLFHYVFVSSWRGFSVSPVCASLCIFVVESLCVLCRGLVASLRRCALVTLVVV